MASGRPVISTRLFGIPKEYFPHLFLLNEETPDELASLLISLDEMPKEKLNNFGDQARSFILENKSELSQGSRMIEFIRSLKKI